VNNSKILIAVEILTSLVTKKVTAKVERVPNKRQLIALSQLLKWLSVLDITVSSV
jgi:hypothetical protein